MPTGMERRREDAALGIRLVLRASVDREREDAARRKQVLILPELGDDLLFGAGIAFVSTQFPVSAGVDVLRRPAE